MIDTDEERGFHFCPGCGAMYRTQEEADSCCPIEDEESEEEEE